MSLRLRDLIKVVREVKTAAGERAEIAKECAEIRKAIRSEDETHRRRNVAKLLYIHMLGYPTHFGQLECLKLVNSPTFPDKRVGYLGLMVLLDENTEILMLATHALKNDLLHQNPFVVGLSLTAIGNISSEEIARDAAPEVQKLLHSPNAYVRKKAALCATRIARKVPDMAEIFVPRLTNLLSDRNHGVLVSVVALIRTLCEVEPDNIADFRACVPLLVRTLGRLVKSGYSPDHDVHGVTDPFLQVHILGLLRVLGSGDEAASEKMNDILAQVATNTDSVRNVGNAILYECVQTIMVIESSSALRILGINLLGKFLLNRDNNIRYVALNTLHRVVHSDIRAVQRHSNTILDCLYDPDTSIKKRALPLVYALVNEDNVQELVRRLLDFLPEANFEIRPDVVAKICMITEKYAPNKRWLIDTLARVMHTAGRYVQDETLASLVSLIISSPELHAYAAGKFYLALSGSDALQQPPLVQAAVWCVGEYGDVLVAGGAGTENETITVSESDVISLFDSILKDPHTTLRSKEYTLNALMKLTTRFSDASLPVIQSILGRYSTTIDVEIQQRAWEYTNLFNLPSGGEMRRLVLERMPAAAESREYGEEGRPPPPAPSEAATLINLLDGVPSSTTTTTTTDSSSPSTGGGGGGDNLLDLLMGGPSPSSGGAPQAGSAPAPASGTSLLDILSAPAPTPTPSRPGAAPSLLDMMTGVSASAPAPTFPPIMAYQKGGITVNFEFSLNGNAVVISATYNNGLPTGVSGFSLQAAVPKYATIEVESPSGTAMPSGGTINQTLKVVNSQRGVKKLAMKIRLEYTPDGGGAVVDEAVVSNFPMGI